MGRIDGGLRALFRERLPQVHWQSIETAGTGRGVPDSNGCYAGVEFWVEYKVTDGYAVELRPEQVGWHCQRSRAGGRTFVAVRRRCLAGPRKAAADELWLLPGRLAREVRSMGLRELPDDFVLGAWTGGPAKWDWGEVLRLLTAAEEASPQPRMPGETAGLREG